MFVGMNNNNHHLIDAINSNKKLNDEQVMCLLHTLKFYIGKKNSSCNIRIVDSQLIKLYLMSNKHKRQINQAEHRKRCMKKRRVNENDYIKINDNDDEDDDPIVTIEERNRIFSNVERHGETLLSNFVSNDRDILVILPLNAGDHWSLIIYYGFTDTWFHVDSLIDYHSPTVNAFMKMFMNLLKTKTKENCLIPTINAIFHQIHDNRSQVGNWECGYYMIIFAGLFIDNITDLRSTNDEYRKITKDIRNVSLKASIRIDIMNRIIILLRRNENIYH
jgi:hypothetical protein